MKNYFLIFFVLIFFNSCVEREKENIPDYVLSEKKLLSLVIDIHIADAVVSDKKLFDRDLRKIDTLSSYYNSVFVKHKINRAKFNRTMRYYSLNPDFLEDLYENVLDSMKKMELRLKDADTLKLEIEEIEVKKEK